MNTVWNFNYTIGALTGEYTFGLSKGHLQGEVCTHNYSESVDQRGHLLATALLEVLKTPYIQQQGTVYVERNGSYVARLLIVTHPFEAKTYKHVYAENLPLKTASINLVVRSPIEVDPYLHSMVHDTRYPYSINGADRLAGALFTLERGLRDE